MINAKEARKIQASSISEDNPILKPILDETSDAIEKAANIGASAVYAPFVSKSHKQYIIDAVIKILVRNGYEIKKNVNNDPREPGPTTYTIHW